MKYSEMYNIFKEHNLRKGIKSQFGDNEPLKAHIIYSKDNWEEKYTLEARTYIVRSDNKCFVPNMLGVSMFGDSLDGSDKGVRLDCYDWKIERIYIE